MKKRVLSILLALAMVLPLTVPAAAAPSGIVGEAAAQKLYGLGLFYGAGTNADGSPNFDLNRAPTRQEGIAMLVRLLGKEEEARQGSWTVPFTDVANWAKPYVGYAYENGLTYGVSETLFGGSDPVSAAQYITFVLRAMGYQDQVDFQWKTPWTLSNQLGFTAGSGFENFTRGNAVEMSYDAMICVGKDGKTLGQTLINAGVFTREQAADAGLVISTVTLSQRTLTLEEGESATLTANVSNGGSVTWKSSDTSVARVSNGKVTAVKAGTATITASAGEDTASCTVTVSVPFSMTLSQTSLSLKATKTATLTATVSDGSAVTWSSSNESVASVSASGVVRAKKVGSATVTATAANGKTASCAVTVRENTPFDVPVLNHEYGPMTVKNYYSHEEYWYGNQIESLVFTKAELVYEEYCLYISMKGTTDNYMADVKAYLYDANDRVLGEIWIIKNVAENTPYNVLTEQYVDKDVLEQAVRLEFYSYDGHKAESGIKPLGGGSGDSGSGSGSSSGSGSGSSSGDSGVTIDRNAVYASYPDVPDFGKVFGVKALEEDNSGSGTFYTYSASSVGDLDDALENYADLLKSHGFRYDSTQGNVASGFIYDAYSRSGSRPGTRGTVVSVGVLYSGSTPTRIGVNVIQ